MTFEGWDAVNPFTLETKQTGAAWVAMVKENGKTVFTTRPCRLKVQAERLAIDWIQRDTPKNGVMLEVQNLSVDADSLFSRR